MSFHKREITDYIKDIPMRLSNLYAQLQPENNLNVDLNPVYVDYLTEADFDYDFNVERTALLDAERERERILKEAEEKLKELELNNKLNETQVKKPIEDVINSSQPIQFTNLTSTTNYVYPSNSNSTYITNSNPNVYNSYNNYNSIIQNPSTNNLTTSNYQQTNLTQTSLSQSTNQLQQHQSNLTNSLSQINNLQQQTNLSQSSSLSQSNNLSTSLPQSTLVQQNSLPTNLHLNNQQTNLPQQQHNLSTANYFPNNLATNILTRNLSINLPTNDQQENQLTKNNSDNNIQQQQHIYQQQQYSINNQLPQSNLNNYIIYSNSPTNNNYSTNSIKGAYDMLNNLNLHVYPQINQNNNQSIVHSNSQIDQQTNHKINFNTTVSTNYVPSTTKFTNNNILQPQQHQIINSKDNDNSNQTTVSTNSNASTDDNNTTKSAQIDSTNSSINLSNLRVNGKKIDVADFENSSSPFDDALLKSIDDKEELNNIFQQFYNGGRK